MPAEAAAAVGAAEGGGVRLYVYFRVADADAAACVAAVRGFQAQLMKTWPALRCEVLQRAQEDGLAGRTLMETYALPGAGIDAALRQRIEHDAAAALGALVAGTRHVEAFEPCA